MVGFIIADTLVTYSVMHTDQEKVRYGWAKWLVRLTQDRSSAVITTVGDHTTASMTKMCSYHALLRKVRKHNVFRSVLHLTLLTSLDESRLLRFRLDIFCTLFQNTVSEFVIAQHLRCNLQAFQQLSMTNKPHFPVVVRSFYYSK